MILVDHQILAEIELGRLVISPFDPKLVNPSSLDVRMGRTFGKVTPVSTVIDPTDPSSFTTKQFELEALVLHPGEFILAKLEESITLPPDISAKLMGKSSLGRLGLSNSHVAGWIDPGFSADSLVLELFNHSKYPILLKSGMKIGQLVFFKHVPAAEPYGNKSTSKYQNQTGIQGAKGV